MIELGVIPDIRKWADWGKTIPSFFAVVIQYLSTTLEALDDEQRKVWLALKPKLDSLVTLLDPRLQIPNSSLGWVQGAWEANLASVIKNFPLAEGVSTIQLLWLAIGREWFNPPNEQTIENWERYAKEWVDQQNALNDGTRKCCPC